MSGEGHRGVIAWMIHNKVTPNLLMIVLLVGGLFMTTQIKQEVFPDFDEDMVSVTVVYPGASPEEVERGIILAIESAIRGMEGIKELTAMANEGVGVVMAEMLTDADQEKVYQDIKQAVDRITTFPRNAERAEVTKMVHSHEVLSLEIYGDVSEWSLREGAEQIRDRLLMDPRITQIDINGKEYQIHIEVPQPTLRAYGLKLQDIANRLSAASVELPGGKIETSGGEILLRVKDRRDWAREFARIPIITSPEGSVIELGEIAEVREGFEDTELEGYYDGKPSIGVLVFRVGDQTPLGVSAAVRELIPEIMADLPEGLSWAISKDRSDIYRQRLELLLKNAFFGLILVLVVLGLFLEFRLAFWVTMGIPISFLGALLFLPFMGVSINMISIFAFIIALGIVVDDAIVAGENIYELRNQGAGLIRASIEGTKGVAIPIAFSILTNVVTFMPLYSIPGQLGKVWKVIPLVVITAFLISWFESIFILPSHLAHARKGEGQGPLSRMQRAFAGVLRRFIVGAYGPFLRLCLKWRYVTMAVGAACIILILAVVMSGRLGMILMPRIEADTALVTAILPYGSPKERCLAVKDQLVGAMERVAAAYGRERLITGIFALVNENMIEVNAYLTEPDVRPLSTAEVTELWREELGPVMGLETLRFEADRGGPGSGAALTVELSHGDISVLERASGALAARLAEFPHVKDIDDGASAGKEQLSFHIKAEGESLGLTAAEVGNQVRNAYYGAMAGRQQRQRSEVRILVRLPEAERQSERSLEDLLITTATGRQIPLRQVADVDRGRAYTVINRRDARRTVTVTANVEPIGETSRIMGTMNETTLPQLRRDFPGLTTGYEGRQADMRESMESLINNFILALFVIYFLLAIPFRSYIQPLIVMLAIPFGIVGAVLGHMIMGYNLSLMSMMGMVALAGVVVNDSLVLIDYANQLIRGGMTPLEAIYQAGLRRFRPILLTTLTTFGGLAPMIFETSRQARFMIPMALSLGYGLLFATVITLIIVPCLFSIIEDAREGVGAGEAVGY